MTLTERNKALDKVINNSPKDCEILTKAKWLRIGYHKGIITFNECKEKLDELKEQAHDTMVFDMHFGAFTMKKKLEKDLNYFETAEFSK